MEAFPDFFSKASAVAVQLLQVRVACQLWGEQPEAAALRSSVAETRGGSATAQDLRNCAADWSRCEVPRLMQENFKKVRLQSAEAVAHVPVLGDFKLKLENVRLEGLELDKASTGISLGEDGTLVLVIRGLDAVVNGHLQWRRKSFPFISGGCQAVVTAEVSSSASNFHLQLLRQWQVSCRWSDQGQAFMPAVLLRDPLATSPLTPCQN